MTVQFPETGGDPPLPSQAICPEQAGVPAQPAPDSYTSGMAAGNALVVQPDDVARMLGLTLPLSGTALRTVTEAIMGAQSDVEAYLGRPVVPLTYTDSRCVPHREGWTLGNYPVLRVVSATPETDSASRPTGLYTVVYIAGLDTVNDRELFPIARYVKLHAAYDPFVQVLFRQLRPDIATRVMSGSTEGQSATVVDTLPTPGSSGMRSAAAVTAQQAMPGSAPLITTLDRWRLAKRRVYQRPRVPGEAAPWPHDPPQPGTQDLLSGGRWEGTW